MVISDTAIQMAHIANHLSPPSLFSSLSYLSFYCTSNEARRGIIHIICSIRSWHDPRPYLHCAPCHHPWSSHWWVRALLALRVCVLLSSRLSRCTEILHGLSCKRQNVVVVVFDYVLSGKIALKTACACELWTSFSCNSAVTFSPPFQEKLWKKKETNLNHKVIKSCFLSSTFRDLFFPSRSTRLPYRLQISLQDQKKTAKAMGGR